MTARQKKRPRVDGDRYYSPKWMAEQMVDHVFPVFGEPPDGFRVLEPSCGLGSLSGAIIKRFPSASVTTVDPDPLSVSIHRETFEVHAARQDVLGFRHGDRPYDVVVQNPPFGLAEEHVLLAYDMAPRIVTLARIDFLSSQRRMTLFEQLPPTAIFILPNRPSFDMPADYMAAYPVEEYGAVGTDQYSYCWIAWDRTKPDTPTQLHWLPSVDVKERRG